MKSTRSSGANAPTGVRSWVFWGKGGGKQQIQPAQSGKSQQG
jgi:hypothetical protein